MIEFDPVEQSSDGGHTFTVFECRPKAGVDLAAVLARTVRDLYVNTERLRQVLLAAAKDTAAIFATEQIEEAVTRTLAAAIPEPGVHSIRHLDTARNEVAEALAHLALPALHGTVIPAARIEHKEVGVVPSRGLDLLGLEESPLAAVVCETKASDEANSPPAVVGSGETSLRGQFARFLGEADRLLAELNWGLKHADPSNHELIARAILTHVRGTLAIIASPVLVRPRERRGRLDFGTFRDNPAQFSPARVRFSLLVIDGPLEQLAEAVYRGARL